MQELMVLVPTGPVEAKAGPLNELAPDSPLGDMTAPALLLRGKPSQLRDMLHTALRAIDQREAQADASGR